MKKFIIDRFAMFLMSGMLWTRVKHVVEIIDSEEIPGADKRERAFDELAIMGIEIGKFMVNLAIELAVAYLRMK